MIDLTELMSVIEYADNHQVKNVRYHLRWKTVFGSGVQKEMYGLLKEWALIKNGLNVVSAFNHSKFIDNVDGIVIRTEKRNCYVFVYFG